jgi:nucleoid DNA-binding protein
MNSDQSKQLLKKLAVKYKSTTEEVRKCIEAEFSIVAKAISGGNAETLEFDTVYLPKFGTFKVKDGKKWHLKQKRAKKKKNQNSQEE